MKKHGPARSRSRTSSCSGDRRRSFGRRGRASADRPGAAAGRAGARPRGSTAPPARSAPAVPRRSTRARRLSRASPATPASRRRRGAGARRAPTSAAGSASPWRGTRTSRRRSIPAPAARMSVDAVPGREKGREGTLSGRLDLFAQRRERGAAQAAHDLDVGPFEPTAAGSDFAPRELAGALELAQHGARVDAVAHAQVRGRERSVGARVARDEPGEGVVHVGEERLGQAAGRDGAERVAVEPGVVGGHVASLAAEAQRDRAPFAAQARRAAPRESIPSSTRSRTSAALRSPSARRTSCSSSRPVARVSGERRWSSSHDAGQRAGVDQLAQLLGARAARAAGRGRATARRRGARRWACRPRTCRSRRSRTAARRQTARRPGSRPRRARSRASAARAAARRRPGRSSTSRRHSR